MHTPRWLIADPEPYEEYPLGRLKTGKEADVFLIERLSADGRSCLLAHKRYRPRRVSHKGELEELGFQRPSVFVNDRSYRHGRQLGNTRDQRATSKKTRYGRKVLNRGWRDNEFEMLERLWRAGVSVPFPVDRTSDGLLMQYIGDHNMIAPRLVHAGLERGDIELAASQLIEDLRCMVNAGVVHADLSAFNLLWWEDRLWIIDWPQAVEIGANIQALDFLHRDLMNVAAWFERREVAFESERLFSELLASAF